MANSLDEALANARIAVAVIKRDTVNEMRGPSAGYSTIAQRLGLTKGRVQQIANAPRKRFQAAYAFRDESGAWHGEPGLLEGAHYDAPAFIPFGPADRYNPLAGQVLTVRYGEMEHDHRVSLYTLPVRLPDDSQLNLRMTTAVMDALFGPADTSAPEHAEWEARREARKRELGE